MSGLEHMRAILREAYRLPDVVLRPLHAGAMNENVWVDTPHGCFVLKFYKSHLYAADDIRSILDVQGRVRAAGVPTPELVRNREGQLLTETETEQGCYLLSAFVPGSHHPRMAIPERAAYEMGRTLGRLHDVLQRVPGAEPYRWPDPVETAERLERLLEAAERQRAASPVDEAAYRALRGKLDGLERLDGQHRALYELPSQWVHGDYHETNVLFTSDDQVAAVLDFDNLRSRPRGHELMRAIKVCFYDGSSLLPTAYDFFAGYVAGRDVDASEVRLYVPMMIYYSLTRDWPIRTRYEQPQEYDPRWDKFILPETDWWERHQDEVTENFLRAL